MPVHAAVHEDGGSRSSRSSSPEQVTRARRGMEVDFGHYRAIEITRDGPVLRVTFDRPDQLNAISREVHAELQTLFFDIDRDDATRLAVLTGKGRAFCAGGDLDWLLELHQDPSASAREFEPIGRSKRHCSTWRPPLWRELTDQPLGSDAR